MVEKKSSINFLREVDKFVGNFENRVPVEEMRAVYETKRLHYDLIQEVLRDMAYESELGFLSPSDKELYDILTSAWLCTCLKLEETPVKKMSQHQAELFISRLEDKLDQRLECLPGYLKDDPDPFMFDKLTSRKREALLELDNIRSQFTEAVSSVTSTSAKLFGEARAKTQPKLNLHVATVLEEQAKYVAAQSTHLALEVKHELQKPSVMLDQLKKDKSELETELQKLQAEVKQMQSQLSVYLSQDAKYYNLVKRYKECQHQLEVHCELLAEKDAATGVTQVTSARRNLGRRSFSLSSLPKFGNP